MASQDPVDIALGRRVRKELGRTCQILRVGRTWSDHNRSVATLPSRVASHRTPPLTTRPRRIIFRAVSLVSEAQETRNSTRIQCKLLRGVNYLPAGGKHKAERKASAKQDTSSSEKPAASSKNTSDVHFMNPTTLQVRPWREPQRTRPPSGLGVPHVPSYGGSVGAQQGGPTRP